MRFLTSTYNTEFDQDTVVRIKYKIVLIDIVHNIYPVFHLLQKPNVDKISDR